MIQALETTGIGKRYGGTWALSFICQSLAEPLSYVYPGFQAGAAIARCGRLHGLLHHIQRGTKRPSGNR